MTSDFEQKMEEKSFENGLIHRFFHIIHNFGNKEMWITPQKNENMFCEKLPKKNNFWKDIDKSNVEKG